MERTTIIPDDNACLAASAALSAGATTGTGKNLGPVKNAKVTIIITAVSGTSPTLDTKIQGSIAVGGTYYDIVTVPQAAAVGVFEANFKTDYDWIRHYSTVGGSSTPTVTCEIWVGPED